MVRPGAYRKVEHIKGALLRWAPVLLTNIRIGWNSLPETTTLTYYANLEVTKKIKCCENDTWGLSYELFTTVKSIAAL